MDKCRFFNFILISLLICRFVVYIIFKIVWFCIFSGLFVLGVLINWVILLIDNVFGNFWIFLGELICCIGLCLFKCFWCKNWWNFFKLEIIWIIFVEVCCFLWRDCKNFVIM